jgi:hypothetical protein
MRLAMTSISFEAAHDSLARRQIREIIVKDYAK